MSTPPRSRAQPGRDGPPGDEADPVAASAGEATAGAVYEDLIKEQLAEERNLKASLEQRGITVVTTAGTLVSLLFGLAAVVTTAKQFSVPGATRAWLTVAAGGFLLAAVTAIAINWPRRYQEAAVEGLRRLVQPTTWKGPNDPAARRVTELRVEILLSARRVNRQKARLLTLALVAEVVGISCVAMGIVTILRPTG